MANTTFSQFFPAAGASSGGGGGTGGAPGTTTTVNGDRTYSVYTSGLVDIIHAATGGAKTISTNGNNGYSQFVNPSLVTLTDSSIGTFNGGGGAIGAASRPENQANNNVYQTILSHTGKGIFYWADVRGTMNASGFSNTTGYDLRTNTCGLRVTIDGGTPIEWNTGAVGQQALGVSSNKVDAYLNIAMSQVWDRELKEKFTRSNPDQAYLGLTNNVTSVAPSGTSTTTTLATGGNALNAQRQIDTSTSAGGGATTISHLLSLYNYNAKYLSSAGVPGFLYETSILIEGLWAARYVDPANNRLASGTTTRNSTYCVEKF